MVGLPISIPRARIFVGMVANPSETWDCSSPPTHGGIEPKLNTLALIGPEISILEQCGQFFQNFIPEMSSRI